VPWCGEKPCICMAKRRLSRPDSDTRVTHNPRRSGTNQDWDRRPCRGYAGCRDRAPSAAWAINRAGTPAVG
jgi:hypothetical protein